MALNWVMMHDGRREPIPLSHESTQFVQGSTEVTVLIPVETPDIAAGASGIAKRLKETGKIWLTNQRVWRLIHASLGLSCC